DNFNDGHTTTVSDWDATFGSPTVVSGSLVTSDGDTARREYNGPTEGLPDTTDEGLGAVNESNTHKAVYYRVDMTREGGVDKSGLSSLDFGSERIFFGVPEGRSTFWIVAPGFGEASDEVTPAFFNRTYTLVAKIDFANDLLSLWIDPDLSKSEYSNTPLATLPYTGTHWSTAVSLSSNGESGARTLWDDLIVSNSWNNLDLAPIVTTAVDEDDGAIFSTTGTGTSLRELIMYSQSGAEITFDPSLSGKTITLGGTELVIDKDLTIDASALARKITISGGDLSRIFKIEPGTTILLDSLTLTNGFTDRGGAIDNRGDLTLNNANLRANSASEYGGAIFNWPNATATINLSEFTDNSAVEGGGAIGNGSDAQMFINHSTIAENHSKWGGGVLTDAESTFTLNHSTIAGNYASENGGGIYDSSSMEILVNHSTITGNAAGNRGGGMYYFQGISEPAAIHLDYSIVAANTAARGIDIGFDQVESVVVNGLSFVGDTTDAGILSGPVISGNPLLSPLGYYGGPTMTMHPLVGSPVIDAGGDTDPGGEDQRGFIRFVNGALDIGAVEAGPVI
ncbi:MAG: hypothetical protein KJT03_20680, partial [Verrucomicrobiae bacterium]|nr:hypothetical protein [Verrucomicrobiae bacterium]